MIKILIPPLKLFFLIVVVVSSYGTYFQRLDKIDSIVSVVLYSAVFLLLFWIFISAAYIKNNRVRLFYGVLFFIAFLVEDGYFGIMGYFLTYSSFISLMEAVGFAGDALSQFHQEFLLTLLLGLCVLLGVILTPNSTFKPICWLRKYNSVVLPPLGVFSLAVLIFAKGGEGGTGLPAMFTPLSYYTLYAYDKLISTTRTRQSIAIEKTNKGSTKDIVYIVDESIRGDYLDINSSYGVRTNLKTTYDDIEVINYGLASSVTTCSAEVNLTLRYGGTREDYLNMIYTMPSLWRYAQNAGMRTVYIDAQRTHQQLQNGMTWKEQEAIDDFIQFDNSSILQRDQAVAHKLIELINNDTQEFIYVNKMGGHFPVNDKYPDTAMRYKPVLPRGGFLTVGDTGDKSGFAGGDAWLAYRNSYRNTLLWNVGSFFFVLLTQANLDKATVIYTSDHGQDLHERGNEGKNTHCGGTNANIEEGIVPLLVIKQKTSGDFDWKKNAVLNKNKVSHFNLFPTLLLMMGYDKPEVNRVYGTSLFEQVNDPYTFNTRFYAHFGSQPEWKKIIPAEIAAPDSDEGRESKISLLKQQVSKSASVIH
jgi:glucan phosphoethanolaminetransferase (alkaline phosphatase superfamily)